VGIFNIEAGVQSKGEKMGAIGLEPTTLYVNRSVIDLDGEGLIRLESGEALNDLKSKNCSVRIAPALPWSAQVPTIS
jgi:hypothetical protein